MEKKQTIIDIAIFACVFFFIFIFGNLGALSGLAGDFYLLDEGQFASWIGHMLAGKQAYTDIYIQYGPLMIYPIYILMKIFGQTVFLVRFWEVISITGGVIIAYYALKQLKVVSKFLYFTLPILVLIPGINIRYWSGILVLLLFMKGTEESKLKFSFLSGVAFFLALFQSFEIGVYAMLVLMFFTFFAYMKKSIGTLLSHSLIFLAGFLIPTVMLLSIAFFQGWLPSYIATISEVSSSISGNNSPNGQGLPSVMHFTNTMSPLALIKYIFSKNLLFYWSAAILSCCSVYLILKMFFVKIKVADKLALLIVAYAFLVYFGIVGRSGHYFAIVPLVITILAYIVSESFRLRGSRATNLVKVLIAFAFILYVTRHLAIFRIDGFRNLNLENGTNAVERVYPLTISASQALEFSELQGFIDKNTSLNDKLYIASNLPGLYFILNRQNSTRYDLPLMAGTIEKRYEIVNQLSQSKPKFIIEDLNAWAVDGVSDRHRMPEVFEYIDQNYQKFRTISHFIVYQKR